MAKKQVPRSSGGGALPPRHRREGRVGRRHVHGSR